MENQKSEKLERLRQAATRGHILEQWLRKGLQRRLTIQRLPETNAA